MLEPSFAAWAFSAFFLLLKRNAIVPCEADHLLYYSSLPEIPSLSFLVENRDMEAVLGGWVGEVAGKEVVVV